MRTRRLLLLLVLMTLCVPIGSVWAAVGDRVELVNDL
jgi:hypothetical protein